jgi:hypothetical protein
MTSQEILTDMLSNGYTKEQIATECVDSRINYEPSASHFLLSIAVLTLNEKAPSEYQKVVIVMSKGFTDDEEAEASAKKRLNELLDSAEQSTSTATASAIASVFPTL